jgi:hypothetical protein
MFAILMPDENATSPTDSLTPTPEEPKTPVTFPRFMELSLELRQIVYGFTLAKERPLICTSCANSGFALGPAEEHGPIFEVDIFCVSKQVYEEAKTVFMLQNTFRLNDMSVSKLQLSSEVHRQTLWNARHLIVLHHLQGHIDNEFVFGFECPRFRHLETFYLILYHKVPPNIDQATRQLGPLAKLWVGREATIEWRVTEDTVVEQRERYLTGREGFKDYLRSLEKAMVKGPRPDVIRSQQW